MIDGLYWQDYGRPDAPPVILSAGLGGMAAYWRPNLDSLAQSHRVILYDHRGTGRSDRALEGDVSVEAMADDVLALMDGLGLERSTLIGHAAGGAIGLALAIRAPQRLERLVVVNGWSRPDPHFLRCFEIRLALLRDSGVRAYLRAQPLFLYPARWISDHDDELAAEEAEQLHHFQGKENLEARIAALAAFDIDSRLGEIATPTLLIAAGDDMLVPDSCSERLAAGLRNSTLERMTGGHACNVTHPDVFNSILLAWLAGSSPEGAS